MRLPPCWDAAVTDAAIANRPRRATLAAFMTLKSRTSRRYAGSAALALVAAALLLVPTGCGKDARLAGQKIRDPKAETFTAYGKILDKTAGPRDVAYVLLQAIVDDYAAGDDREKREAALDVEFGVCAPDFIRQKMNSDRLNERERQELLYRVVYHWAPVLGHYRASFAGEFPDVATRMHVEYPLQPMSKTELARVFVNLDHPDPQQAGPNSGAVGVIRLVRENGYWRVWSVGFDPTMRDWRTRFPPEPPADAAPHAVQPGPTPTASPEAAVEPSPEPTAGE